MMSTLPPAYGSASPTRRTPAPQGGGSRLLQMQARFQAKQMIEKEEKLINMLEEKQDMRVSGSGMTNIGSVGGRPPSYGGGKVRQMFEERRIQSRGSRISPVGWDKSYPLEPVQGMESRSSGPMYKPNVSRQSSYNKYSGNYGPSKQPSSRGVSLDRTLSRHRQNGYGYQRNGIVRTQSHANIAAGGSSSEDSSRPHSGFGYHNRSNSTRFDRYEISPEDSPPPPGLRPVNSRDYGGTMSRDYSGTMGRDYTRPLPPSYRRDSRDSPARNSYHDSAYSSHSSDRSDVNQPYSNMEQRHSHSTQSSPVKSYSRQNSFSYDQSAGRINSRTFRKHKSPVRRPGTRSPSLSPTRSGEYSDTEDFGGRAKSRTAEREREEERRRMQVEMRKREQELLARIKDQQRELEAVKMEKMKMERELNRQERDREEESTRRERQNKTVLQRAKSQERILSRERAAPAMLRSRRPPQHTSTVSEAADRQWQLLQSEDGFQVEDERPVEESDSGDFHQDNSSWASKAGLSSNREDEDNDRRAEARQDSERKRSSVAVEIPIIRQKSPDKEAQPAPTASRTAATSKLSTAKSLLSQMRNTLERGRRKGSVNDEKKDEVRRANSFMKDTRSSFRRKSQTAENYPETRKSPPKSVLASDGRSSKSPPKIEDKKSEQVKDVKMSKIEVEDKEVRPIYGAKSISFGSGWDRDADKDDRRVDDEESVSSEASSRHYSFGQDKRPSESRLRDKSFGSPPSEDRWTEEKRIVERKGDGEPPRRNEHYGRNDSGPATKSDKHPYLKRSDSMKRRPDAREMLQAGGGLLRTNEVAEVPPTADRREEPPSPSSRNSASAFRRNGSLRRSSGRPGGGGGAAGSGARNPAATPSSMRRRMASQDQEQSDPEERTALPPATTNRRPANLSVKSQSAKKVSPTPSFKKKAPAAAPATRRSVFAPKPRDDLVQCSNCSRNFSEDRIEKHEEICRKTSQKKRKTFDMTKARVKGTDAAAYVNSSAQLKAREAKDHEPKKADWRKKREEFIATLRAAKEAQRHLAAGGSLKDLPPPPPMDTSDYIQCPHCSRRFAESAAERHIPKCKNIKSNKK